MIVNVSSWVATVGVPTGALYAASKATLDQLTRGWAAELGPSGIRVNAVAPGITMTEGNLPNEAFLREATTRFPAGRVGRPEEIAAGRGLPRVGQRLLPARRDALRGRRRIRDPYPLTPCERELTARGAATRARIVEGAAELIRERGIAAVAMDDIRAATSTSKSQLFHYFPGGRTELLAAVTQHEADRVLEDQRPAIDDLSSVGVLAGVAGARRRALHAPGRALPAGGAHLRAGQVEPARRARSSAT